MVLNNYCICNRERYSATEYHYARCLVCYLHIPHDEVVEGCKKLYEGSECRG